MRKMKKESGAIVIEATISLTAFMFAIITLLSVVNICIVQAKVANAINSTAKELSEYSYLYSLTGVDKSMASIAKSANVTSDNISGVTDDISSLYNEISSLGNSVGTLNVSGAMNNISNIKGDANKLGSSLGKIAEDPKNFIFGLAKMAASDLGTVAGSKLVAKPVAEALCKKHLLDSPDSDVETYLKSVGVQPDAKGSYYGGLDFSDSLFFPKGSNEITIDVKYSVKVIPLLPIDFSFDFHQVAKTHGWLCGESSYVGFDKYNDNNTLWTEATVHERSDLIRHQVVEQYGTQGYSNTSGLTDVQMYDEVNKTFLAVGSVNPLYTPEGEDPLTVDDIDEKALSDSISRMCKRMTASTSITKEVNIKDANGKTKTVDCTGAKNELILVIPEDPKLKEKIEKVISETDTDGVKIIVTPSYGSGASKTKVETTKAPATQNNAK